MYWERIAGGAINFKILKRTAGFKLNDSDMNSNPVQQTKPLPIPKRSKLFLEQSMRERQNAIGTKKTKMTNNRVYRVFI